MPETNPYFDFRQRYSRLYYQFKVRWRKCGGEEPMRVLTHVCLVFVVLQPDYYYWILIILARKFLIAFAELMFRKNPFFQLCFILLILFVAYTLQVPTEAPSYA
jgi:hypothetical protein